MYARRTAVLALAALALWPAAPAAAKETQPLGAACGLTACVRLPARMIPVRSSAPSAARVPAHADSGPTTGCASGRRRTSPCSCSTCRSRAESRRTANGLRAALSRGRATARGAAPDAADPAADRRHHGRLPEAAHPQAYTTLLYGRPVHPAASVWNRPDVLIQVDLAGQTPWVDWGAAEYFPSVQLLHIPDGTWVHVGPAQAAMIASDRGLPQATGSGSRATPIAVAALLVAVAAAVIVALRRRPWRRARVA